VRIATLEHEPESPAALFGEWALARGHELEVIAVPGLEAWPDPAAHDLIVSLGSDCSVHASSDPWIAAEIDYLRAARSSATPVLGICFGAQILAAARGGSVRRAERPDARWQEVVSGDPDLITSGPWLCWHDDIAVLPAGAEELARDELGPLAFRDRRDVGIQFHPEVDEALASAWIDGARESLVERGVDEASLRAQARAVEPGSRARAFELFDRFAASWWE
jgi:GMP synthase-like glutamine amidotransferase